jgi:hypothetical protein
MSERGLAAAVMAVEPLPPIEHVPDAIDLDPAVEPHPPELALESIGSPARLREIELEPQAQSARRVVALE